MRFSTFIVFAAAGLISSCGAFNVRNGAVGVAGDAVFLQPYQEGLAPRYFLDGVPAIARRDDSACASGYHSCLDINSTLCCSNDRYCIIDPATLEPACCSIGLMCDSPCNDTQYECNATSIKTATQVQTRIVSGTVTLPETKTAAADAGLITVTATVTTTSIYSACCGRHCPGTSQFRCASSFGGGCCSFGQTCGSSSMCIWTSAAATQSDTQTGTGLVSALPSGCTTDQISCASSLGGGCCATGHTCTVVSSQVYCAAASGITNSTTTATNGSSSGLSTGAKAGVALGAVIGVAAVIAFVTWLCIRQRHRNNGSSRHDSSLPPASFATYEYDDLQQQPRQPPQPYQESLLGSPGGGGAAAAAAGGLARFGRTPVSAVASSPAARSWRYPLNFRRNTANTIAISNIGGVDGGLGTPAMPTESDAGSRAGGAGGAGAAGRLPGLTQDYFGPLAIPGPFTQDGSVVQADAHGGSGNVTPLHGVPMQPHGPHDIVAPVEIDSTQKAEIDGVGVLTMHPDNEKTHQLPQPSQSPVQQHFELYGSEVPASAQELVDSPTEGISGHAVPAEAAHVVLPIQTGEISQGAGAEENRRLEPVPFTKPE